MDKRFTASISELSKRNDMQFGAIRSEIRGLSDKLDITRDVAVLKAKMAELEKRK